MFFDFASLTKSKIINKISFVGEEALTIKYMA